MDPPEAKAVIAVTCSLILGIASPAWSASSSTGSRRLLKTSSVQRPVPAATIRPRTMCPTVMKRRIRSWRSAIDRHVAEEPGYRTPQTLLHAHLVQNVGHIDSLQAKRAAGLDLGPVDPGNRAHSLSNEVARKVNPVQNNLKSAARVGVLHLLGRNALGLQRRNAALVELFERDTGSLTLFPALWAYWSLGCGCELPALPPEPSDGRR